MIRRILVFLAVLFVAFFAWRRYDRVAADNFLHKVKNFSFSKKEKTYTTTIIDPNGTTIIMSGGIDSEENTSDKTGENNNMIYDQNQSLLKQILTPENLWKSITWSVTTIETWTTATGTTILRVDGLSGEIIMNTGVSTIENKKPIAPVQTKVKETTTPKWLSAKDIEGAEELNSFID